MLCAVSCLSRIRFLSSLLLIGFGLSIAPVFGQGFSDVLNLGGSSASKKSLEQAEVVLKPAPGKTDSSGTVILQVKIPVPDGSHTYSMWSGFSGRTNVRLDEKSLSGLKAIGEFEADRSPKEKQDPILKQRVEYFEGDVTFTQRFQLLPGTKPEDVTLSGEVRFQICDANSCRPMRTQFSVSLSGPAAASKFNMDWQMVSRAGGVEKPGPTRWTVTLSPENAKPGDRVTLSVTSFIAANHHVFALDQNPKNTGLPTEITIDNMTGLRELPKETAFKPSSEPVEHEERGKVQRFHREKVTFTRSFEVAAAKYGVSGRVNFQVCLEGPSGNCRPGRFSFDVGQVAKQVAEAPAAAAGDGDDDSIAALFDGLKLRGIGQTDANQSLGMFLVYAFLGGLILNIMPCVLPVIAIKALSFAQQAGESRMRILALNGSYAVGVVSVFVVLATLAAFNGLSWGAQFQDDTFSLVMCVIVFAMGLSLLGVYEIPVPGFAGSVAGGHREGLSGAFLTGIFATVMATPCSGPFLGATLAWAVKQPAPVIYAVWITMGIGLAFPYLVFAVAPGAVKLLPKPGNWMIYFKQVAGFAMLGTTIYLLSVLPEAMLISSLILLLGVGMALWMIGSLYNYSSSNRRRWIVRFSATGTAAFMAWLALAPGIRLDWQPFSPSQLEAALNSQRPVIIDFTADWCATCKTVEKLTLNTRATKDFVEEHQIVTLKADWTDHSDEIREVLNRLGADAIPTLAIFSPARPKEPIVLQEAWSKSTLLKQLEVVVTENSRPTPAMSAGQSVTQLAP